MTIQPGTRWFRKRGQGHADLVIVVKVSASLVHFRERDLKAGFSRLPLGIFLGTYAPEKAAACQRCSSLAVKDGHRYCESCTALICAVRNKKKREKEAVLTTTNNVVIEEKRRVPTPPTPPVAPPRVAAHQETTTTTVSATTTSRWRITGRRVIVEEKTVEVEGVTVIDALAAVESEAPGIEITDVHLLDRP